LVKGNLIFKVQLLTYSTPPQKCQAFLTNSAKNQKTFLKEQKFFGMFEEICQVFGIGVIIE